MRPIPLIVTLAVVLLGAAPVAMAGEAGGHNLVVPKQGQTTELPNGKIYMTVGNHQVCTMSDSSHPLHRASGDCDGGCVAEPEGEPSCMGSCTWVDLEGDLAFFTWEGAQEGSWRLAGGTGKYAGATGEGTWKADAVYAGGITGNSWSGSIDLP